MRGGYNHLPFGFREGQVRLLVNTSWLDLFFTIVMTALFLVHVQTYVDCLWGDLFSNVSPGMLFSFLVYEFGCVVFHDYGCNRFYTFPHELKTFNTGRQI